MKQILNIKTLSFLLLVVIFTSCQKVIVLDLNTAETQIVIEGNVTNTNEPTVVIVSTTGSYYTGEGMGPLEGATVLIRDGDMILDSLEMLSPGIYLGESVYAIPEHEYHIDVVYDNKYYTASEVFPEMKTIDSLHFVVNEGFFGEGGVNEDGDSTYNVICTFQDPAATLDYYRFWVYIGDSLVKGSFRPYSVTDDELFNGQLYDLEFSFGAIKGDSVTIELQSTGYNTYQYFYTLNDALSGGMGSTPYNPITNMSNNALGYFGAYTSDKKSIIINP